MSVSAVQQLLETCSGAVGCFLWDVGVAAAGDGVTTSWSSAGLQPQQPQQQRNNAAALQQKGLADTAEASR
jgi:hypothetical protein